MQKCSAGRAADAYTSPHGQPVTWDPRRAYDYDLLQATRTTYMRHALGKTQRGAAGAVRVVPSHSGGASPATRHAVAAHMPPPSASPAPRVRRLGERL